MSSIASHYYKSLVNCAHIICLFHFLHELFNKESMVVAFGTELKIANEVELIVIDSCIRKQVIKY